MLSWLQHAYSCPLFWRAILTTKVGYTDLGLSMQDYKSLCAAVMICSSLVNMQTNVYTHLVIDIDSILTSLCEKLSQLS